MEPVQRRRFEIQKQVKRPGYNPLDPTIQELAAEEEREHRRNLRIGIVAAAVLHVILFLVTFPEAVTELKAAGGSAKVYVIQQVRFRPPESRPEEKTERKPKAKKIPIPDPTPDDPEPIVEDIEEPPLVDDVYDALAGFSYVPDGGPPGPALGALPITGDITAPVKVFSPQPQYTEDARQARVQGMVILQTVVDTDGNVVDVKVLKGLPSGLTESAIETVSAWRFLPAMRGEEPVAVHFLLTISFSLQ